MGLSEQTYTLIFQYLNNKLSEAEKASFESEIEQNEELKVEISILKQMDEFLLEGSELKSVIKSDNKEAYEEFVNTQENKEFYHTIQEIATQSDLKANGPLNNPKKGKIRSINLKWLAVAAAVVLALAVFAPTIFQSQGEKLYTRHNNYDTLPSLVTKSSEPNLFYSQIEEDFSNGKFEKVKANYEFTKIGPSEEKSIAQLYYNISLAETGNVDLAIERMNFIYSKQPTSKYADWAQYYEAMFYLKKGEKQTAKDLLQLIANAQNHKKQQRAKSVLKDLK